MPLAVGDELGPYEILAPIDADGTGGVYRAEDTKLDRQGNKGAFEELLPAVVYAEVHRMARQAVKIWLHRELSARSNERPGI